VTAPGRSANPPLGRKVDFKQGKIKIYLTQAGILMEGRYAQTASMSVIDCMTMSASAPE
jgi:hypothetical protein